MKPLLNLLKPSGLFLLLGILQRTVLFVICKSQFFHFNELFYALGFGLIYDISFICILLFIFLTLAYFIKPSAIKTIYFFLVFIWVIFNGVDILSFYYTGTRTSLLSFDLFSFSDISTKLFSSSIAFIFIAVVTFFGIVLFYFRKKLIPEFESVSIKRSYPTFLVLFIFSLVYLPFPVNFYIDQINVSKQAKLLGVNPYYSWFTSIVNSSQDYPMDKTLALSNFKKQLGYSSSESDFLSRKEYYGDSSYNTIVLVVMESFGANRIGALNGRKKISPNFDSLCKEGTLYTKCFACGPRTQYGITSLLFGFPHILKYNIFRQNKLKLPFVGLPKLLKENNYASHFIHGGDAAYDDMDLFLGSTELNSIRDVKSITNYKFKTDWGIDDESLFEDAAKFIDTKGKNLYCILSMSNHEPFLVPKGFEATVEKGLSKSEIAFAYSDHALGKFIEKLKQNKKYEKCLIIITGDHGEFYSSEDTETKLFHVPLLIIDHKNKNKMNAKICSHADVAEYILSKTQFSATSHFIGQGLTTAQKESVYYRSYEDDLYKVTDSVIYKFNLTNKKLDKLYYSKNLYIEKSKPIDPNNKIYLIVSDDILSYYTSIKFIFETGSYKN